MSPCPKWRSLSTSGFCSRVRVWDRPESRSSGCGVACASPHGCDRRQSSRSTGQSSYLHLYMVLSDWLMTERMRPRVQAAKMGFLHRVAGVSLRDRVKSSAIREGLGVEPLLLCMERNQLRWFGHLMRMPPGHLPREVFLAHPTGRKPRGRPRASWRDYISSLAWERLGNPQSDLAEVAREREVWGSLLNLLPLQPDFG